jgi:drug/metabolite transporter (DMT)-like permease
MHAKKSTILGLFGVLGIWLTAGLALPFVNILSMFTPPQLMVFRGFMTAAITLAFLRGNIGRVDKYTYLIALVVPFVTLGLFEGIRYLGVGPTIIIITATPLVNLAISIFFGRRISYVSVTGLLLVLGGVILARWGGNFHLVGFMWAVFATVMNGILYELWGKTKSSVLQKTFYNYMGMGTLGFMLSAGVSFAPIFEPKLALLVFWFVLVGGFLYGIANMIAFENLPTMEASILAQGETVAVILGASILLGEHLAPLSWLGVCVALFGAGYLSRWLGTNKTVSG